MSGLRNVLATPMRSILRFCLIICRIGFAKREVMYLDEDAETLEHLLRMVCGMSLLPFSSYNLMDAVLHAAEKYDMPGISLAIAPSPIDDEPIRFYGAACRYGWDAEAKLWSTRTLI